MVFNVNLGMSKNFSSDPLFFASLLFYLLTSYLGQNKIHKESINISKMVKWLQTKGVYHLSSSTLVTIIIVIASLKSLQIGESVETGMSPNRLMGVSML